MLLTDLITPQRIKIPLAGQKKDDLLQELVDLVVVDDDSQDAAAILEAVRAREEVLSTGIGRGIAIPHGRTAAVSELRLAAGVTRQPIDFDALDGEPVRIFFLLIGPESAAADHIRALSRISRLVRRDDMRDRLASVESPEEFYHILNEFEGL